MKTSERDKTRMKNAELAESENDRLHLEPEETTMDLPDVKDIPGQEHIHPPPAGEMADTTISSDGEEGKGIIGLHDEDETLDPEGNVSRTEKELLAQSSVSMGTRDDEQLKNAALDNLDEDGEPLNEKIDQSGADLDVPGTEEDDSSEDDEENSQYSLNDDKEDEVTNRQ